MDSQSGEKRPSSSEGRDDGEPSKKLKVAVPTQNENSNEAENMESTESSTSQADTATNQDLPAPSKASEWMSLRRAMLRRPSTFQRAITEDDTTSSAAQNIVDDVADVDAVDPVDPAGPLAVAPVNNAEDPIVVIYVVSRLMDSVSLTPPTIVEITDDSMDPDDSTSVISGFVEPTGALALVNTVDDTVDPVGPVDPVNPIDVIADPTGAVAPVDIVDDHSAVAPNDDTTKKSE